MRLRLAIPLLLTAACSASEGPERTELSAGTWGGENAGVLVNDSIAHVHVGCTFGYFTPVPLDRNARFTVAGNYTLRAYPIVLGPSLPAQYTGVIQGNKLTLTVVVNDTVEDKTVTVGPSVVYFGREPRMGPCPICDLSMKRP